jgi:hypothetical protein
MVLYLLEIASLACRFPDALKFHTIIEYIVTEAEILVPHGVSAK